MNDDEPIGRVLSRREVLKLLGAAGLTLLVGCGPESAATTPSPAATAIPPTQAATLAATSTQVANTVAATSTTQSTATTQATATTPAVATADTVVVPSCIVRPEMTEGPYFVDERLNRSDIRSDPTTGAISEGLPFNLTFRVSKIDGAGCLPLAGAYVDIWHCDLNGVYSDAVDRSFDTTGQKFLRGYQVTDANGIAQFQTIYPGWYDGRTVHIHFKIRTSLEGGYDFTSQLFFDDSYTDEVYTKAPYSGRSGSRSVRNNNDNIYLNGGDQLQLQVSESSGNYAATFDIGLQL